MFKENIRINFYKQIILHIKKIEKQKKDNKTEMYLMEYKKMLSLISWVSNGKISDLGLINFEEELRLINQAFAYGSLRQMEPLLNFIFKDIIFLSQKYWLMKKMDNNPIQHNLYDIEKYLGNELYSWVLRFIFLSYNNCRASKTTIIEELISFLNDEQIRSNLEFLENIKKEIFYFSLFLFRNENSNDLYISTKEQKEEIILLLFKLGPNKNFPNKKFLSAMHIIIQIYTVSLFKPKENNKIYHITSIKNFDNIMKSGELWVKTTTKLNDPLEQKAFIKILKKNGFSETILEKDFNNDYFSFSTTNDFPSLELMEKYCGEVILEYDYSSISSLFFGMDSRRFWSPLSGRVIYDELEIAIIWKQIVEFLNKLKKFTSIETFIKKSAWICNAFYKTKEWSHENEIRLIMTNRNYDNLKEEDDYLKLNGEILTIFDNIYISDNKSLQIKSQLNEAKISYENANMYKHINFDKSNIPFHKKIKTIK